MVQAQARRFRQRSHRWRAGEVAQSRVMGLGITEAGVGQHAGIALVGQALPITGNLGTLDAASARLQQTGKSFGHQTAVPIQRVPEGGLIGVAQGQCDAFASQRGVGQRMLLPIGQHLHAVLDLAQETIGLGQPRHSRRGQMAGFAQGGQGRQQSAQAQPRFAAGANKLQRLHEKFDFADTAGAKLEVVGHFAALDLGVNQALHFAQAVQRGVVQVAAIHEGLQLCLQALAGEDIASDRPCFHPGVALPVAAFALVVLLHRGKAQHQSARSTEGPQPQIHAVAKTLGADLAQQRGQALAHARVVSLGIEWSRAIAAARFGVGIDQVNVGGKIQLAAAQLAQAKHHQRLRTALDITQLAVALAHLRGGQCERGIQSLLGNAAAAGQGLLDAVQAEQIAPDQTR